jgi:hypothetical protein
LGYQGNFKKVLGGSSVGRANSAKQEYRMKVLLKHAGIGLYYAGRKHWVGDADSALDLETVERATELSRDESFMEMDIVVTYDEPGCELVLPLRQRGLQAEPAARGD